jgi:hypothetical protein
MRLATFIDVAQPRLTGGRSALPWQADVGLGLRLQLPACRESLRLDFAHATRDGDDAVSLAIEGALRGWR